MYPDQEFLCLLLLTLLLDFSYMGQISPDNITTRDIRTHADVSIEKMVDIHRNYSSGAIKTILDGGMEALRYIENIAYDATAEAFITAQREYNVPRYGQYAGVGQSEFSGQFQIASFGQNAHSGWDLPPTNAAWAGNMLLPIGHNSPNGFLTIAAAYEEAGTPERFQAIRGFSGELGKKVHAFTRLMQEYISYVKVFYPGNPALNDRAAAPWYHRPTAFHTLWDAIVVPHHRVPLHVRIRGRGAAQGAENNKTGSARIKALIGKSGEAIAYLSQHLVGEADTFENIKQRHGAVDRDNVASLIGADLGVVDGGDKAVVFSPFQRRSRPVSAPQLLDSLPAFARQRYSNIVFDSNARVITYGGVRLRRVVLGEKPAAADTAQADLIRSVSDLIMGLIHNTAQDETVGNATPEVQIKRETARALILNVLAYAQIDDLSAVNTVEAQATIAARIKNIVDNVLEKRINTKAVTDPNPTAEEREDLLTNFASSDFIAAYRAHAYSAVEGSALQNPYKYQEKASVDASVKYLQSILLSGVRAVEELKSGDVPKQDALKFSPSDYQPSPLLYSPQQLRDHYVMISGGADPIALPADTLSPAQPMSVASEATNARLIRAVLESPNRAAVEALDHHLVPLGLDLESQVRNMSVLSHMERAKRHQRDLANARNFAAQERVGAPGLSIRRAEEMQVDAASDMQLISPSLARAAPAAASAGVVPPVVTRKRTFASEAPARDTGNQTFRSAGGAGTRASTTEEDEDLMESSAGKRLRGSFGKLDSSLPSMLLTSNMIKNWRAITSDRSKGLLNIWTSLLYLTTPFNAIVLKNWAANNLLVPIRAILFRFAVLGTYSIIK